MAPVIEALAARPHDFAVSICVTGQHRRMLDQMLELFEIRPDFDLDVMTDGQTLTGITCEVLRRLEPLLATERPDWVVVQGDTTTTYAAALAAFYAQIPVAHVEAGLRSGSLDEPRPEEMNRRATDAISELLFAPTELAAANLLSEGVPPDRISVTGNTVVDAFKAVSDICLGLRAIAANCPDVHLVIPVHLNPNVRGPVEAVLSNLENVSLVPPLEYPALVWLLQRSEFVITDSGGLQEEAVGIGKQVLVLRDRTERMEGVEAGLARLVGSDRGDLAWWAARLLDGLESMPPVTSTNLYGDGHAAERIADRLARVAEPVAADELMERVHFASLYATA